MSIFSIIVTYNGLKWIDFCLGSIRNSSISVTPIVVDNGSTDNTLVYIQSHYPEVILLPQNKNLGFGQANNKGIEYAISHGATHILLINQDAALQEDTISKLLKHDDNRHLLTPIHLNGNGEHIDNNFHLSTIINSSYENNMFEDALLNNDLKESYPIQYVNAACWFLPISIFRKIGGFNPLFFQYGEDNNYLHRMHYHKFGIKLVTHSFVYHDRKTYGNEIVYKKGAVYRQLLLVRTNINLSTKQRFIEELKFLIQNLGHSIKNHYLFSFIGEALVASIKILFTNISIRKSRRAEKETYPTWLEL